MKVRRTRISQAALVCLLLAGSPSAHELDPAVADLGFTGDAVRITVELNLEALLAGISLGHDDTSESPEAAAYDAFRAMDRGALEAAFRDVASRFAADLLAEIPSGPVTLVVSDVEVPPVGDLELPRYSRLVIEGALPSDAEWFRFGWAADYGQIVVRTEATTEGSYAALLPGGELSDRIDLSAYRPGFWARLLGWFGL